MENAMTDEERSLDPVPGAMSQWSREYLSLRGRTEVLIAAAHSVMKPR